MQMRSPADVSVGVGSPLVRTLVPKEQLESSTRTAIDNVAAGGAMNAASDDSRSAARGSLARDHRRQDCAARKVRARQKPSWNTEIGNEDWAR